MTRALTLVALLTAAIASAQDLATYNKALSAYNGGSFEDSAKLFFDVANTTTDTDLLHVLLHAHASCAALQAPAPQ